MALMGGKYTKTIAQLITPRQNIKIAAALARATGYKTIVESPRKRNPISICKTVYNFERKAQEKEFETIKFQ